MIGKRVRVIDDQTFPDLYNGLTGVVTHDFDCKSLRYGVKFDEPAKNGATSDRFNAHELVVIDGDNELTLSGTLEVGYSRGDGQHYITIDGKSLWSELYDHNGKRIELTIRVLDDAPTE